jgi:hypothetical protein
MTAYKMEMVMAMMITMMMMVITTTLHATLSNAEVIEYQMRTGKMRKAVTVCSHTFF